VFDISRYSYNYGIIRQLLQKNNITPTAIIKDIRDWGFSNPSASSGQERITLEFSSIHDKKILEKEMKEAAKNLDLERAAEIRDLIKNIKPKSPLRAFFS